MLRISFIIFICPGLLFSSGLIAADDLQNRLCNLQSREIALRISEEVSSEITAEKRSEIALIAEEVCLEILTDSMESVSNGVELETNETSTVQGNSVEEEGLLGDIRIIEPEDRVRRPGLKRR